MGGVVTAVSSSPEHLFSKPTRTSIRLLAGLGVDGDAHMGEKIKHRGRVARDPSQPNLRNPCLQLDGFQRGLMKAVLGRDEHGNIVRKAGIMGIVLADGTVRAGDPIHIELPPRPHQPLEPV